MLRKGGIFLIYDCFTYFNEIELISLRLQTLSDSVDRFVIVEANQTHSGLPRDFHFPLHRQIWEPYADQIIYIQVEDMPQTDDTWVRENFQRNCIRRGLQECRPEDLILISDADEIPDPRALQRLLGEPAGADLIRKHPVAFAQRNYMYFVNLAAFQPWHGTVAVRFANLKSPQTVRDNRERSPRIRDGGWHFSYMGGVERVIQKFRSFAHQEFKDTQDLSPEYIEWCIENGVTDIHDRSSPRLRFVALDDGYPAAIRRFIGQYPAFYREVAQPAPAEQAYAKPSAALFYNKPRWYWFLWKQWWKGMLEK